MLPVIVSESQPWEKGTNYDNVGANGGGKIIERSERANRLDATK